LKLLVPIDGSDESEKALNYAVKLQQQLLPGIEKKIIVITVVPHFHIPSNIERLGKMQNSEIISISERIEELNDSIRLSWVEELNSIKRKYEPYDLELSTEIISGSDSIYNAIISLSDRENVDIIVIGNIGLGSTSKNKSLGSISRNISELAHCNVLIIR